MQVLYHQYQWFCSNDKNYCLLDIHLPMKWLMQRDHWQASEDHKILGLCHKAHCKLEYLCRKHMRQHWHTVLILCIVTRETEIMVVPEPVIRPLVKTDSRCMRQIYNTLSSPYLSLSDLCCGLTCFFKHHKHIKLHKFLLNFSYTNTY